MTSGGLATPAAAVRGVAVTMTTDIDADDTERLLALLARCRDALAAGS